MEFADFRRDDETFEKERKKYASLSVIMKDKVVVKEGKEGARARKLRTQGEELINYQRANDEMIDNWNLISIPEEAFHKVTDEEAARETEKSDKELKKELGSLLSVRRDSIKEMIINISITLVFIAICIGLAVGILKLDELLFIKLDNIYMLYGGYVLIHAGIPILVFRLLRLAEGALMEHYIRCWHQILYILASLAASLLMFNYMVHSTVGIIAAGVSQAAVILLTIFPRYQD